MEAILDGITSGKIKNVTPRVVISSKPNAPALEKAKDRGIPTQVVSSSSGLVALIVALFQELFVSL